MSAALTRAVAGSSLVLALFCFAAGSASAACFKGETLVAADGKLRSARFTVPAYHLNEEAYILDLSQPACLEATDEYDKVDRSTTIHVYSTDAALLKRLRSMVGKTVHVSGYAVGEQNMHHHAPIVMSIENIDPL